MKKSYLLIGLFIISITLFSCKNEAKDPSPISETETVKEKASLSDEDKKLMSSILSKAMVTPELKTFISYLITTGQTDMLAKEEGPFTILGPTNEAFGAIGADRTKFLLNPANRTELDRLVKSHLIEGSLDSANLLQQIKDGSGSYEIMTLSGVKLTASLDGDDIVITDQNDVKGVLGKTDINGTNGVLHVLNAVLMVN